jgi:hypothetical protein
MPPRSAAQTATATKGERNFLNTMQ